MDPQALDLSQRSARAAIPYAAGLAVVFAVMGLIPCLGGASITSSASPASSPWPT